MNFKHIAALFFLAAAFFVSNIAEAVEDMDWHWGEEPIHSQGRSKPADGKLFGIAAIKDDIQITFRLMAKNDMSQGNWTGDIRAPEKFYVKLYLIDQNGYRNYLKMNGARAVGEDAEYGQGAAAVRGAHGVHGGGYGTFNNEEGTMYWYHENDGAEGVYSAVFRYTHNGKNSKRPLAIYVNNKKAAMVEFEPTGSWDSKWDAQAVSFTLVKGANHIEFRTVGESGPNIDQFTLE